MPCGRRKAGCWTAAFAMHSRPTATGLGSSPSCSRPACLPELARENIRANGVAGMSNVTADLGNWHCSGAEAGGAFDHAFSNPPWHDHAASRSPIARRDMATHEQDLPLEGWVAALMAALRPRGSMTLVLTAAQTGRAVAAFRAVGLGGLTLVPLWPKPGRDAKLLIVQAWRDRRDPDRLTHGLTLHEPDGRFSDAARSVLRDGGQMVL